MIEFTCVCEWTYIVGKKKVFGPIFDAPEHHFPYKHTGRLMTREEWEDGYGDCVVNFRHQRERERERKHDRSTPV